MFHRLRAQIAVALATAALGVSITVAVRADPRLRMDVVAVSGGAVELRGRHGTTHLDTSEPVHAAAVSPSGGRVAVASGRVVHAAMGGVRGDVHVVDVSSGRTILQTGFEDAVLTEVAYSPDGATIAFVKDYEELWLLDIASHSLQRLLDVRSPPLQGQILFDPVFAPSGKSLYFGVVEETFHGEDDKLDNLWRASLDGRLRRITNLRPPSDGTAVVLRSPLPMPAGGVLVTVGNPGEDTWRAAIARRGGVLTDVGPVPALSSAIAADEDDILFTTPDATGWGFDLLAVETDVSAPSWRRWCETSCELVMDGVAHASGNVEQARPER